MPALIARFCEWRSSGKDQQGSFGQEAEWSLRAGLVDTFQPTSSTLPFGAGLLQTLGTTCAEVVANNQCQADVNSLDQTALDSLPGTGRSADIIRHRVQTVLADNAGVSVGNFSCPEACGLCPKGDGAHRPPRAPRLQGADWACNSGDPKPTGNRADGDRHLLQFTCPETDGRIGGAAENAAEWRHTPFAQRQADWLDTELGRSTADWKVVVGHYPVW